MEWRVPTADWNARRSIVLTIVYGPAPTKAKPGKDGPVSDG